MSAIICSCTPTMHYICTYAHAVFDENLFPRCSEALPHKLVSGPVQPHIYPKERPHPSTEVAGEEYEHVLPGPRDIMNLRHLETCYPLCKYLHQKFVSELLHYLQPLQGELSTLMHLQPYHTDQSESDNRLVTQAISMENTEILSNRLRKLSQKPLGKTLPVNPPLPCQRHHQFLVPCLHPPLLQRTILNA